MTAQRRRPAGRTRPARITAVALLAPLLWTAACGGGPEPEEPAPTPVPPPAEPEEPRQPLPAPPWSGEPLDAVTVPDAYMEAWADAENREWCGLLAFADPAATAGAAGGAPVGDAEARTANFSSGWGVAYDLPGERSAFGVAGTGVEPGPGTYDDWPYGIEWEDGSTAGYGPEGGSGPTQLAYVEVAGQRCLYNVWSRLGRRHLEALLSELRFVQQEA